MFIKDAVFGKITSREPISFRLTNTRERKYMSNENLNSQEKLVGEVYKHATDVVSLNRDVEAYMIQAGAGYTKSHGKYTERFKYAPIRFVHFSDVHRVKNNWNRVVDYINYYNDYISFGLHTGDYCGASQEQYVDLYNEGTECLKPIYNCVGNHDSFLHMKKGDDGKWDVPCAPKKRTHELLFNSTANWEVNWTDVEFPTSYYKDFTESNIRMIVLDNYYDREIQSEWLRGLLNDALERGIHIMTALHIPSGQITTAVDTGFNSLNSWGFGRTVFDEIISEFIQKGGAFIANFAGDHHHDIMGYTDGGVLNIAIESCTPYAGWLDSIRAEGTKSIDAFNVVGIDTNLGLLKLVRVGDNCDQYMRRKAVLCYDYINKKKISGD